MTTFLIVFAAVTVPPFVRLLWVAGTALLAYTKWRNER